MKKIYLAMAYRYMAGNDLYVCGVFTTPLLAQAAIDEYSKLPELTQKLFGFEIVEWDTDIAIMIDPLASR